jgi:glycosyltransferase involved in cell wall biosynthesis
MIVNNMGPFGGLQEFAKNLAIGVQKQGHQVSVFSAKWDPSDNQYIRSLHENNVTFVQLAKWVSVPSSDWPMKKRIQSIAMWLATPLVYLLGGLVSVIRKRPLRQSFTSARNWLQGQLISRFEPHQRQPFVLMLLEWWRLSWRPDLIHIHGYTSDLLYVIEWAHAKKIPVVYEEHQTPDAQFDWWQDFKDTINKASTVIAVSEKSAQALREVCGVTQPIAVAYYMVPDPVETGWKEASKPGNIDEPVQITTNARLYITKGLNYLLEAITQVKAIHPNAQFRVYGDGPLREELLSYAEKLGLDGNQIFVGAYSSRDELSQIMGQTDIFVLSSILEGLPIAMLEAMSFGRPVVVTPVGGIPEAIEDGVNGLLCTPGDSKCLAQKINTLIEDPALRLRLGLAARKAYEAGPFNPIAVSNRHISIYKNVLAA